MTFDRVIEVAGKQLTVTKRLDDGIHRILSVRGSAFRHDLEFLSYYEASLAIDGELLIAWAGTRLYCCNVPAGAICTRTFDTDIVCVFSNGGHLIVVSELTALMVNDQCAVDAELFSHHEIIVEAKLENRDLVLRDLQNRSFRIRVEDLCT